MGEFFGTGRLEAVDQAALRIDARHHVLDDAVLAGGIHPLEHDQHRPVGMSVETLLHGFEPRNSVGENCADLLDVGRKPKTLRRIEVGKLELFRLVDPAMLDDLGELHRQWVSSLIPCSLMPKLPVPKLLMPWIDKQSDDPGDALGMRGRLPRGNKL